MASATQLEFEKPIANDGGLTLTFVFDFKKNKQHALGRFRISVCPADEKAAVEAKPEPVSQSRTTPSGRRERNMTKVKTFLITGVSS